MRRLLPIVGGILLLLSGLDAPAYATDYQLQQTINALNCTITETSNGSGTTINSDCPAQPPVVTTVVPGGGRPVIRGLFDAANSQTFRVRLLGVWYVLGINPELTAIGNVWILDLSGLTKPLEPGVYVLQLEMTTHEGDVLSATGQLVIPGPPITIDPDPPGHSHGGSLAPTGDPWVLALTFGLLGILVGGGYLARRCQSRSKRV